MVIWEWDKAILERNVQGCGQGTIPKSLQAFFHKAIAKEPSWGKTQEEFNQLNLGIYLSISLDIGFLRLLPNCSNIGHPGFHVCILPDLHEGGGH